MNENLNDNELELKMVSPKELAKRLKSKNSLRDISERQEYDTNSNNCSVMKDEE